jgi:Pilin (bacterial filament)
MKRSPWIYQHLSLALCAIWLCACNTIAAHHGGHEDGFEPRSAAFLVEQAVHGGEGLFNPILEYRYSHGQMPASLTDLGLTEPHRVGTAHASLVNGVLLLSFADGLSGQTLGISLWNQAGAMRFVCGFAPIPLDASLESGATSISQTSLAESLLPESCRSDPSAAFQALEVLRGMSEPRIGITEYFQSEGNIPASLTAAGYPNDPWPIRQARVRLEHGLLIASFSGVLEGQTVALAPWQQSGSVSWFCGHGVAPQGATPLATQSASANTSIDPGAMPLECRE